MKIILNIRIKLDLNNLLNILISKVKNKMKSICRNNKEYKFFNNKIACKKF
jgi:hypothetical protein